MFGRENSSPTTTVSCESTEVFRKEELQTRAMDEKRGKQKRRDRVFKTKTHNSAKTKTTGGDVLAQIKAKENIVAPNNGGRVTISRESVPSLVAQKVGIYNRGKSSLMVSRRRPLHDIQPSQNTVRETRKDLKRVLGYSSDGKSPRKRISPLSEGNRDTTSSSSHVVTGGQRPEEPKQSGSEMEMSPDKQTSTVDGDSVRAIARRIAGGLHPRMVYPDSDYLRNTKAELRKLLKQGVDSSREAKVDMDSLVACSLSNNPPANGVFLLPPSVTAGYEPNDSFFSFHLYEDQTLAQPDMTPSPDYPMDMLQTSALFPPSSPPPSPPEAGPPLHLTEVELTTTSDHTYPPVGDPFQMEPTLPSPMAEPPRDFLDLLDTMQQGTIGENPPNFPCTRAPGAKWLPTPERPPMFPQKLY